MSFRTNNPSVALQRQDGPRSSEETTTPRINKFKCSKVFSNPNRLEPSLAVSDTLQRLFRKWEAERYLIEEIRAEPLSNSDFEQLIELGIPRDYIEYDWLKRSSPILRSTVSFDSDGRFFGILDGDPEAVMAFVFAISNIPNRSHEIIAWHSATGRVASYHEVTPVIGRESLFGYRMDQHATIHPTLLSWLAHGRKGAFLRDEHASLPYLRDAGGLHFLDPEQAKRVHKYSSLQNIIVDSPYAEGN
jgi:hypothetical protein